MNTYFYRVLMSNGSTRLGVLRLTVERDLSAKMWLERRFDGVVLQLFRLPRILANTLGAASGVGRLALPPSELAGFLRDLAVMTGAGIPIIDALRSMAEETDASQKRIAGTARLVMADLDGGASVSQAFDRHPDLFPESVRNLMLIGEETGNVDRMRME